MTWPDFAFALVLALALALPLLHRVRGIAIGLGLGLCRLWLAKRLPVGVALATHLALP